MAKKGSANRTEVVREYMSANPTKSNTEIQRELEDQGTVVSGSLVSQVRKEPGMPQVAGPKKKAAKKTVGKKKAASKTTAAKKKTAATQTAKAPATDGQSITADELYDAKQLADELGGIARLREALNALERLR